MNNMENAAPVTDIENAIELMLAEIRKRNRKSLITVNEVTFMLPRFAEFVKMHMI